jgi:hypothetical protein
VPKVCLLDPDGERGGTGDWSATTPTCVCSIWADRRRRLCVGASFAVLVAEEMFASDCDLLISVTSSGEITPQGQLSRPK